jgi:hypothetical protein
MITSVKPLAGDARAAVAEYVGRHIGKRRVLEELLPMVREASKRVVFVPAGEDVWTHVVGASLL